MDTNIVIPILAALIGVFPALLKTISDRARTARKAKLLQELKSQIEIVETWLKASNIVSSKSSGSEPYIVAEEKLRQLCKDFMNLSESDKSSRDAKADEVGFIRRMLLVFWPQSITGWILHTAFYIVAAFIPMFVLGTSLSDSTGEPDLNTLLSNWSGIIGGLLFFTLILVPIQKLALRVDQKS